MKPVTFRVFANNSTLGQCYVHTMTKAQARRLIIARAKDGAEANRFLRELDALEATEQPHDERIILVPGLELFAGTKYHTPEEEDVNPRALVEAMQRRSVWVVEYTGSEPPDSIWETELDALRHANGKSAEVREVQLGADYRQRA